MGLRRLQPGVHGIDAQVACPRLGPGICNHLPVFGVGAAPTSGPCPLLLSTPGPGPPPWRTTPASGPPTPRPTSVQAEQGEPAVADLADSPQHRFGVAAYPDRDGALHRKGIDAGVGHPVVAAFEVHHFLGPEGPHKLYLLGAAAPASRGSSPPWPRIPLGSNPRRYPGAAGLRSTRPPPRLAWPPGPFDAAPVSRCPLPFRCSWSVRPGTRTLRRVRGTCRYGYRAPSNPSCLEASAPSTWSKAIRWS